MNGNANLNANNLTPQNIVDWRKKLGIGEQYSKWIDANLFLQNQFTGVSTLTTTEIDLSNYLPKDDFIYEVLISVASWTNTTTWNFKYVQMHSDIITTPTYVCSYRNYNQTESNFMSGNIILPVGKNRKVYLTRIHTSNDNIVSFNGYKQISL